MIEDAAIVRLFYERSEQAIGELDGKYGKLFHSLAYHILNNRQDAEECVNEAYLGAWNTIPPAQPDPLRSYVCRIVRNVSLKLYDRKTAAKRNSQYDVAMEELEACLPDRKTVETELDAKELSRMIAAFLETLTVENRVIFMRRYWFSDSCQEIAQRTGLKEKTVSVRLTRMRQKLKIYLEERGVFV